MNLSPQPAVAGGPSINTIAALNAPANTVVLFEVTNVATTLILGTGPEVGSAAGNGAYQDYPNQAAATLDCHGASSGTKAYDTGYLGGLTVTTTKNPTGRHTGGSNFLLADGHAKWLRGASVSPGYDAIAPTDYQGKTVNYAAGTAGAFTNGGTTTPSATFSAI